MHIRSPLNGDLYCWDLEGPYNTDNIEWGSFRNDLWNRGNYSGITGFISGNVSLEGGIGNIEEVTVTAGNVSANPNTNGDYLIEILRGTYDVTATLEYYDPDTVADVLVEEDQTTGGIDFTLYPSAGLEENTLSSKIILIGNYPNPFNPETTISFSVTQTSPFVTLEIFNIKGQKVNTLVDDKLEVGNHQVVWNGKDENGNAVSSGIYFYKIKVGEFSKTKKMILMK